MIKDEKENGLYNKIYSYENGEEVDFSEVSTPFNQLDNTTNISSTLGKVLIIEVVLLIIILIIAKFTCIQ